MTQRSGAEMPSNSTAVPAVPLTLPIPAAQTPSQSSEGNHIQNPETSVGDQKLTAEPFPTLESQPSFQHTTMLHPLDTTLVQSPPTIVSPHNSTPQSAGLRIQTDHLLEKTQQSRDLTKDRTHSAEAPAQQTVFNAGLPVRTSSIRSVYGSRPHRTDSLSPGSVMSSPGVGPLVDMTPLPSPISLWGSPKSWRTANIDDEIGTADDADIEVEASQGSPQFTPFTRIPSRKRKIPTVARSSNDQETQSYNVNTTAHTRQRSISDYVPDGMPIPRSRNVVVSTSKAPEVGQALSPPPDDHMHREQHLAIQRGLTVPKPPTPPDSNHGRDSLDQKNDIQIARSARSEDPTVYEARTLRQGRMTRWQALRRLGKGEFSSVYLATSSIPEQFVQGGSSLDEADIDPRTLVAVKVAEHGPAGGADAQKVETSIRREVELMKSIHHPSLVQLEAVSELDRRTIIVENYCAGGDLFELASEKLPFLIPTLIRRIFTELVAAVHYLHLEYIVHRDIKLENVLVNLPTAAIPAVTDWQAYKMPVVTLTDLGLGRWIPRPPASPMLTTRCGSEDYAAPEVLLGDEYDGRSTDSWALGVLLYAIMEGRLPFDPIPGSRRKTPTSHRIARCDWQWIRYADDDAEWDNVKGKDVEGAAKIVEGLVAKRRNRWNLERVQETEWVRGGITVEGGLRTYYEADDG